MTEFLLALDVAHAALDERIALLHSDS
jgi:hypothetical protein